MTTKFMMRYNNDVHYYIASIKTNQMPIIYKEIQLTPTMRFIFSTSHIWIERKIKRVKTQHNTDAWKMERANYVGLNIFVVFDYKNTTYIAERERRTYADEVDTLISECAETMKNNPESIAQYEKYLRNIIDTQPIITL